MAVRDYDGEMLPGVELCASSRVADALQSTAFGARER
jgi:hypothetical protein